MRRMTAVTIVLALLLGSMTLIGCVESDTAPSFSQPTVGTATMRSAVTAADVSPQTLSEYGVFYSTSRDDIVAVNGVAYTNNLLDDEDFVVRDGVRRIRIPSGVQVGASQTGELEVDIPSLVPNRTYYARFYTIGLDEDGYQWKFAMQVAQFKSISKDATLKSLKPSASKLSPRFTKSKSKYGVTLKARTKKVTLRATPTVSGSKVRMKVGSGKWKTTTKVTVRPKRGKSVKVLVRVTATDRKTAKTYTVKVKRKR